MKKQNSIYIALVIILITSLACNLGGRAPESGDATSTEVPESAPSDTVPTAIPEPLPSGYTELLLDKIASDEWTREEGLITLLKMFAGEIQASDADPGQGVVETEGSGILRLAGRYLQSGTDQAAKDEITRLLNLLVPSQEALDLYSIPEDQASMRRPGLASPARQDAVQCETLWAEGFPDERAPSFPCFLFGEENIAGNSYRVYYPLAWRGDDSRNSYFSATLEAIRDSIPLYQTYGAVKPIYFVFTTLAEETDTRDSFTLASTATDFFRPGTEACPVIINPASMAVSVPEYKQAIAHEIFHCFQAWNLSDQLDGPGEDSEWWAEGTAEYFSNLVYPGVNSEHEWAGSFSALSTTEPLTNMSYENFAFFQFLGNLIGPEGVIAMLHSMPTTPGRDAQLAALSAVAGMEDTFEQFVRAVIDTSIVDSDGSRIDIPENFTDEYVFTDLGSRDFSGQPFVVARYLVSFASEKSFVIDAHSDGVGRSAWRASRSVGGWGPFPATAAGGCEELPYLLYVITTTPGVERTETVTTTSVADAPCDECLIGRWEATDDSALSYMQSVVSASGEGAPTVESVTGIMFLEFKVDGTGAGGYENFKVHETGAGGVASNEVFVTFEGFSSGPYTADGSALTGLGGTTEILVTVQVPGLGSTTVPFGPGDFPVGSAIPTRYTCEGESLTTWPPADGVQPIQWIHTSP